MQAVGLNVPKRRIRVVCFNIGNERGEGLFSGFWQVNRDKSPLFHVLIIPVKNAIIKLELYAAPDYHLLNLPSVAATLSRARRLLLQPPPHHQRRGNGRL